MDIDKLQKFIKDKKLPDYRDKQIIKAVYQDHIADFNDITTIPKDLRQELAAAIRILPFCVKKEQLDKAKKSAKALLQLADGLAIETVLMANSTGQWTACISSQAGCPLGCAFCATGATDFRRNLTAEEISCQVLHWQDYLRRNHNEGKVTNVVYMGMGEPFLNWPEVKQSLSDLTDPKLFGFGDRSISISTAGIPDGIRKLAQNFPQINLAISLHHAHNLERSEIMPVNNAHNLLALSKAIEYYQEHANRKIFLEYIMLAGFNDSHDNADELIGFISGFSKPHLLHVNLIPYNKTTNSLHSSGKETIEQFRKYLEKNKIGVTVRRSLGDGISGACGQLAGKAG